MQENYNLTVQLKYFQRQKANVNMCEYVRPKMNFKVFLWVFFTEKY